MKKIISLLIAALLLLAPILGVAGTAFLLPPQYANTFLGALAGKFDRLTAIDEPKIVVIGGSSVAFGLDSASLEQLTGMPVVNFGLYATLGTKCMIDLSKAGIGRGDIVVLAPETDPQTMSLYFNGEAVWQALDSDFSMLRHIAPGDFGELAGALWGFAQAKLNYFRENNAPAPTGIYSLASFNEVGDIICERPFNVMNGDHDHTQIITFDESLLDADFLDYVNDFAAWCKRRGAALCFSFAPVNAKAVHESTTEESLRAWYADLAGALDCEVISDLRSYILDAQYFFDTNFHLNDTGVDLRTRLLAADILRMKGDTRQVSLFAPDAPKRPDDYFGVDAPEDTSGFFLYEETSGTLTLVGITEKGRNESKLTLPAQFEGKPVTTMAANALAGCERLKTVIIPDYTALTLIENGAFAGAPRLEEIRMEADCEGITVAERLLDGAPQDCMITVSRAYYGNFAGDYFWSVHMARIDLH